MTVGKERSLGENVLGSLILNILRKLSYEIVGKDVLLGENVGSYSQYCKFFTSFARTKAKDEFQCDSS